MEKISAHRTESVGHLRRKELEIENKIWEIDLVMKSILKDMDEVGDKSAEFTSDYQKLYQEALVVKKAKEEELAEVQRKIMLINGEISG